MSNPSDDIYANFKTGKYVKEYLDAFPLDNDPLNPLLNVVPLDLPDFFATKTCNIVCFNGPFIGWDWTSVAATMTRLAACYSEFAKYETHFMVDMEAAGLSSANFAQMDSNFSTLLGTYSAGSYGIHWWGQLDAGALETKISEILEAFYGY